MKVKGYLWRIICFEDEIKFRFYSFKKVKAFVITSTVVLEICICKVNLRISLFFPNDTGEQDYRTGSLLKQHTES